MKTLKILLMLTLIVLLIVPTTAQSSKKNAVKSNQITASEFGIDINATYTGTQVLELLQIAVEEAEASIDDAYAQGYKQGLIKAESYRVEAETYKFRYQSIKNDRWLYGLGGFAIGTCGGLVIGHKINF